MGVFFIIKKIYKYLNIIQKSMVSLTNINVMLDFTEGLKTYKQVLKNLVHASKLLNFQFTQPCTTIFKYFSFRKQDS